MYKRQVVVGAAVVGGGAVVVGGGAVVVVGAMVEDGVTVGAAVEDGVTVVVESSVSASSSLLQLAMKIAEMATTASNFSQPR